MAVGYVGEDGERGIRCEKIAPLYGTGPLIQVIGAVAVKEFQGGNDLLDETGHVGDSVQGPGFGLEIHAAICELYVLSAQGQQFFLGQGFQTLSHLSEVVLCALVGVGALGDFRFLHKLMSNWI